MSLTDNFNPVHFIYLNPEKSNILLTVEDAYNYYYYQGGNNMGLYSNIILPDGWNYEIYLLKNNSNIKFDLQLDSVTSIYSNLILSDPERVAIIHNTRYNQSHKYEYSIAFDFKQEIYKTFNDIGVTRLMPSEYYIDYIIRSNLGAIAGIPYSSLGTITDFMQNFLNQKFTNYTLNTDLTVNGLISTENLTASDTIITDNLYSITATMSNLYVDTLTVTNTSFIDTIFQDDVKLYSNLTVLGNSAIFSNNVQISNLTVLNTSIFNNNVLLNKKLDVYDVSTFYSNIEIKSNVQINNNLLINGYIQTDGNCILNNSLTVKDLSIFNSNVYINSNLTVLGNTTLANTVILSSNLNVNKSSVFNDIVILNSNLNVYGTSLFNCNVQINSNLYITNNLNVINDSTFSNNVRINSNLLVVNNLFVDNNLNVVNSSTFSNNVQINSNLTVINNGKFNTLQVTNDASFSNNLIVSNNIIATEFITVSDYRIKKNITNLDYKKSREIIQKINIKEYEILNSKIKNIGIIAQDLEVITNQLVRNIDNYTIKLYKFIYKEINNDDFNKNIYIMPSKLLTEGDIITYSYNNDDENSEKYMGIVSLIDENKFILKNLKNSNKKIEHSKIFIIDRNISNFKSINYSEITMLCVSCIQDIYNKINEFELKYNNIGNFIV